jgi:hypothetical protein
VSVRFHHWRLGFRQSSFHHIARVLPGATLHAFRWPLLLRHALVPSSFRLQVNRMTQKPPFELLLTASGIQHRVPRRTLSPHTAQHLRSFSMAEHHEAFLRISPAYTAFTVDSLRVRWVPLLQSFHRLGAFAMGSLPRVHGFPGLRLLCPIRLFLRALAFRWGLPCLLPSRLDIPPEVSRVRHVGLQQDGLGGTFLVAPSTLCGSPVPA